MRVAQEERAEKLRVVEIYNGRLSLREQRRDFVRDRGLLNVRRMQARAVCGPSLRLELAGRQTSSMPCTSVLITVGLEGRLHLPYEMSAGCPARPHRST